MSFSADYLLQFAAHLGPGAPWVGGPRARVKKVDSFADGTTDGKADGLLFGEVELAASGSEDIDLKTDEDVLGNALAAVEVAMIVIDIDAGGGDLELTPGSSTGWTALVSGTSPKLTLKAGCTYFLVAPNDGAYAVGASNKVVTLTNASGALTTKYRRAFVTRSA